MHTMAMKMRWVYHDNIDRCLFWFTQVIVDDYNDNCPFLQEVNINLDLEPIPPLRSAAFFTAIASDKDDGVNAQIEYKASSPIERM